MGSRYLWGAAALAAVVALVAGTAWLTTPAREQPPPAGDALRPQAAAGEARRIPVATPPATAAALIAAPTASIALDDKQSLIADHALRAVFEHYLLGKREGAHDAASRLSALHAYLQRQLPPTAALNARQLASNYSAYLSAHDSLLAAQHFSTTPDLNRLTSWQQQRHQLRLRMLGEQVTHEWFGTEDTYLTEAIRQAMLAREGALPAPDSEEEVLQREHMARVLGEAIQPPVI